MRGAASGSVIETFGNSACPHAFNGSGFPEGVTETKSPSSCLGYARVSTLAKGYKVSLATISRLAEA